MKRSVEGVILALLPRRVASVPRVVVGDEHPASLTPGQYRSHSDAGGRRIQRLEQSSAEVVPSHSGPSKRRSPVGRLAFTLPG
jgi:hypothetical protein